jgi:chitodextrinase
MSALNWMGAWSSTASYNVGDVVTYAGSAYVAAAGSVAIAPPAPLVLLDGVGG